jgi:NAD(P)-dependent dehydrogenase (short-subunit alcohol dehydrogenase family)
VGAVVGAIDRNPEALAALAAEADGIEAREVDVARSGAMDAAVDDVVARHGRIDVAVNNAGITGGLSWLHEGDEDWWDRILDVNLKGIWLSMRAELRHMYEQRAGVIVNTASAAGFRGGPGVAHYVASKHGVIGLTRTAALEYAPLGIRINAIAPGTVDTPMSDSFDVDRREDPFADAAVRQPHPLRPFAQPAEIADGILYLAGDQSTFVTGSVLSVDGGFTAQ